VQHVSKLVVFLAHRAVKMLILTDLQ